jgi:hypothetical protein
MSSKQSYDHNESNDEQPSGDVATAAERSNAAGATVELESTRRNDDEEDDEVDTTTRFHFLGMKSNHFLRTKNAAKYSKKDEEAANSSSMSETETEAEAAPVTTSKWDK